MQPFIGNYWMKLWNLSYHHLLCLPVPAFNIFFSFDFGLLIDAVMIVMFQFEKIQFIMLVHSSILLFTSLGFLNFMT